ncbi:acyltransferase domain-containing protein, partial [Streptomyces luteolus]
SIGELTAAHAAGILTLDDATTLVAARGRLMQAARAGGAMAAVEATYDEIAPTLNGLEDSVSVAAVNAPRSVVLSGDEDVVLRLAAEWRDQGRRTHRLPVSHAFHSPHMDTVLDEFRATAARVEFHPPRIPIVSTVTGTTAGTAELTSPDYWTRQIREAVRFADAARELARQGATGFVEIGPDAALTPAAAATLDGAEETWTVPTLRRAEPEPAAALAALAEAHVRGLPVDWDAVFGPGPHRNVELPTYAFEGRRYWLEPSRAMSDLARLGLDGAEAHPFLGAAVELGDGQGLLFTGRLSLRTHPWLADHAVDGTVLLPGTAFVDLALHAGHRTGCPDLDDLTLSAPLSLPEHGAVRVQVAVGAPDEDGRRSVTVRSRPHTDTTEATDATDAAAYGLGNPAPWTQHAGGTLAPAAPLAPAPLPDALTSWPPSDVERIELADAYARLAELGYQYGPAFQGLRSLFRTADGEFLAEVRLPQDGESEGAQEHPANGEAGQSDGNAVDAAAGFGLHPALLDSALHALVLALGTDEATAPRVPFSFSEVRLHAVGAASLRVRISPTGEHTAALSLVDGVGGPVADIDELTLRPLAGQSTANPDHSLLVVEWRAMSALTSREQALPGEVGAEARVFRVPGGSTVREVTGQVLAAVQDHLTDTATTGPLLVLTRGAVSTGHDDKVTDPTAAAAWG